VSTKYYPNLFVVLLIAVIGLSACSPQIQAATQAATQPAASAAPAKHFDGLSSGLDNKSQARIRATSLVMGAPPTDVYVNGMPAFNGGAAQDNIATGRYSGFLYVKPGTYSIALVPHGGTLAQALFPPEDVKVDAGHRYTVAAIGQLADKDVHPLVIDETTLEAGLGAGITDNVTIDINNMTGVDGITELVDDKAYAENIKYGEARAWYFPSGSPKASTLVNVDGTAKEVWGDTIWAEPGTSFSLPWFGPYPADNYDSVGEVSQGTSELNVLDFLAGFDGRDVNIEGHPATFNTFLKIVDKADLRDQMINSGPYFLLAPTDKAFSAFSQADLDALLNDPQALMNLLNAHIVDGYFPRGSLSTNPTDRLMERSNRTVTNRLGKDLAFDGDTVNGYSTGPNYTVGNGNRVQIIYTLLSDQ
jgi:uncharacterized surface protein with fasciclin (FAS1) repeats